MKMGAGKEDFSRRTVLIVAGQAFPPIVSPNLYRVLAWTKLLPNLGWNPVILTLPIHHRAREDEDLTLLGEIPEDVDVRRVSPVLPRSLPPRGYGSSLGKKSAGPLPVRQIAVAGIRSLKNQILIPDTRILWVPAAFREARRISRSSPFDAVLSTSRENSNHLVGWQVARRLKVPWIADLQDPWMSSWEVAAAPWHNYVSRSLARRVLRSASLVTVSSPSIGREVSGRYGVPSNKISVITNGFWARTYKRPPDRPHSGDRLLLVHTGRFYGRRNPQVLLEAAEKLANQSPRLVDRLTIKLVGSIDPDVMTSISKYAGAPWLQLVPPVPHKESLDLQSEADLLLLVPGEDWNALPGKVFEYLGVGKPLLALCSPATDTAKLVRELGAGAILDPGDPEGVIDFLRRLLEGSEQISLSTDFFEKAEAHTWESAVSRMASALIEVSSKTILGEERESGAVRRPPG